MYQLLFGRLWQYDLDAQHVGKENVYRLEKDGVKFTLLPLKSGARPKVPRWISGHFLLSLTLSMR